MPSASLSKADSQTFRKLLAEKKKEKEWTLVAVARVLGCSRKTAWNHLRPQCRALVRASYARGLAAHLPEAAVIWNTSLKVRLGTEELTYAWHKAEKAPARRRVARRIAAFIAECAISLYNLPATTTILATDCCAEPDTLTVTLCVSRTRICGSIILNFERQRRDRIGVVFCNTEGAVRLNGHLEKDLLPKIFNKIRSWQLPH